LSQLFEMVVERLNEVAPTPRLDVALALGTILVLVLVLPFASRKIEENLEPFFFGMGLTGVIVNVAAGIFNGDILRALAKTAASSPLVISGVPIGITQVVFIAGLAFLYYHEAIYRGIASLVRRLGLPVFAFTITFLLGSIASLISVIVTAVILAEIVAGLPLPREGKIKFAVYSAFSVGLGAALTPVGEPLSTIAISKLGADFFYLLRILGVEVFLGIAIASSVNALAMRKYASRLKDSFEFPTSYSETFRGVIERTVRVYVFVAALELLGGSLTPITVWYLSKMSPHALYWFNTISAVVDNATLTAAEIYKGLTVLQIKSALISLLISGGMLIPGNVPNIVMAGRLKIRMAEWARLGVPFGALLLILFYMILFYF
jgi:predicted cation transporter